MPILSFTRIRSVPGDLIRHWIRDKNTIEFPGIWAQLINPDFKHIEFDVFKKHAGLNAVTLTPKQWIEQTGDSWPIVKRHITEQ